MLTLRRFVDAAAALLVEEYQRLGTDLLSACEKVAALGTRPAADDDAGPVPDVVDNRQAVSALMARMSGVKGAPV